MKLDRARRTLRPSVVWLDDKMSIMLEQVGHLNSRGFDVSPTSSITDFLRALQNQRINIVIVDIRLGGGEDGRALVDLVYETRPEIGIIVHSNFPDEFLSVRYDAERVRFVQKDSDHDPVEMDDAWPLADAATSLIDALNKRSSGLKPLVVSLNIDKSEKHVMNWETVHAVRRFAWEHITIPAVVLVLLIKVAELSEAVDISSKVVLAFLYQTGGFVVPFLVAIILARLFTPQEIRQAESADVFVQIYLERLIVDTSLRMNINRQLSTAGHGIPEDDISTLRSYYELLITRRLWIARLILALFLVGSLYLVYDIILDVVHLLEDGHG